MENSANGADIALGLGLTALLKYAAAWWMRPKTDALFEKVGYVTKLYLYPVKSCKALSLAEAECTKYGMRFNGIGDRGFVVSTSEGKFVHARQYPKMVLIAIADEGDNIEITAPGKTAIFVPKRAKLDRTNSKRVELFFGETMPCQDCGDEIAEWINDYLGSEGFRLMRYVEGMETRDINGLTWKTWDPANVQGDTALYTDAAAFMLMNKASVDDLNSRLDRPFKELSFRPNIFIEGPDAFEEDTWSEIRIGDTVRMRCTDECVRCSFTTVDPETGTKTRDGEPLKTLRKYRCSDKFGKQFKESPAFGINTTTDVYGAIKVGDPVYAIRKR